MLKTIFTLIITVVLSCNTYAQEGINFKQTSLKEVLSIAQKENRLVFVNFYSPNKENSNNIFAQKEVGSFFNKNFISIKTHEGSKLAEKYNITSYPTFLFLDPAGGVLLKSESISSSDELIAKGKETLENKPK